MTYHQPKLKSALANCRRVLIETQVGAGMDHQRRADPWAGLHTALYSLQSAQIALSFPILVLTSFLRVYISCCN